mmetsp:Transcript_11367/g.19162  ORF Transcript_11367/g.19162 Transcript_11367/m.19162 type:complete len:117 (-) Transcript_11367:25-375(-)
MRNLAEYKEFKRVERLETIEFLKQQIDQLYVDEKIKEEKLREYTESLVAELRRTSFIKLFAENLAAFMPKYNELKHFNAPRIASAFLKEFNLSFGQKGLANSTFQMTAEAMTKGQY